MNRSREEMLALAERCEAATGPSITLNSEIMSATGVQCHAQHGFTHSLDAAMMLVPDGWAWMCGCDVNEPFFATLAPTDESGIEADDVDTKAATPALATCAAALRTLARENDRG